MQGGDLSIWNLAFYRPTRGVSLLFCSQGGGIPGDDHFLIRGDHENLYPATGLGDLHLFAPGRVQVLIEIRVHAQIFQPV